MYRISIVYVSYMYRVSIVTISGIKAAKVVIKTIDICKFVGRNMLFFKENKVRKDNKVSKDKAK